MTGFTPSEPPPSVSIKRHFFGRSRVPWWKIVNPDGSILADGFSSKREAEKWLRNAE